MPSWSDVLRFLDRDGWTCHKHGKKHDFYRKCLPDGHVLEVMVSREPGEIGGLWPAIRSRQLQCSQAYFNAVKGSGKWSGSGRGIGSDGRQARRSTRPGPRDQEAEIGREPLDP